MKTCMNAWMHYSRTIFLKKPKNFIRSLNVHTWKKRKHFYFIKKRNTYRKQINQAKPHMNIGIANINFYLSCISYGLSSLSFKKNLCLLALLACLLLACLFCKSYCTILNNLKLKCVVHANKNIIFLQKTVRVNIKVTIRFFNLLRNCV